MIDTWGDAYDRMLERIDVHDRMLERIEGCAVCGANTFDGEELCFSCNISKYLKNQEEDQV